MKVMIEFLQIVENYKNVYGTYGIHPHETKNYQTLRQNKLLKKYKLNKKIIGIGESGLDFYYEHSDPIIQKKIFIEHIKAAQITKLPLIVHTRSAEEDTYDILKSEMKNKDIKSFNTLFYWHKNFCT